MLRTADILTIEVRLALALVFASQGQGLSFILARMIAQSRILGAVEIQDTPR